MKITFVDKDKYGDVIGYSMSITKHETSDWSDNWPCSAIDSYPITVIVDSNGLCDYYGPEAGDEIAAIVSDFLPKKYRHLWPTWE